MLRNLEQKHKPSIFNSQHLSVNSKTNQNSLMSFFDRKKVVHERRVGNVTELKIQIPTKFSWGSQANI